MTQKLQKSDRWARVRRNTNCHVFYRYGIHEYNQLSYNYTFCSIRQHVCLLQKWCWQNV